MIEKNFENELEEFKNAMEAKLEILEAAKKGIDKDYWQGEFQGLEEQMESKLVKIE